jgi:hypothetical protein
MHDRPRSSGCHSFMIAMDSRVCRAIILDPRRADATRLRRPGASREVPNLLAHPRHDPRPRWPQGWRHHLVTILAIAAAAVVRRRVGTLGEALLGDLLFFNWPISQVGIYAGDGRMIAAPQRGSTVLLQPVFEGPASSGEFCRRDGEFLLLYAFFVAIPLVKR